MEKLLAGNRSSRTLRGALAAVSLGLFASVVPIATSQASALPRVDPDSATVVGRRVEPHPHLIDCLTLYIELTSSGGDLGTFTIGPGKPETPEGDETDIPRLRDFIDEDALQQYRDLDCGAIPGLPNL